jgi:hypothetical protein
MVKLLTEALAELKVVGESHDGKPASEVIGHAIQEAAGKQK